MKRTILYLILLLITNVLSAQQVDNKKINFTYIQFPTIPVKGVGSYNSMVVMNYQEKVAKLQAAYNQEQAAADTEYQTAMKNYQAELKRADDEYKEAMNQYKMELQRAEDEYQAALKASQQNPTNQGNGTVTKGNTNQQNPSGTANGTVTKGNSNQQNPTNQGNGVTKGNTNQQNPTGNGTVTKGDNTGATSGNNTTVATDTSKVKDKPTRRFVPEPTKRTVTIPAKRQVYPPHYPKTFDEKSLAETYLKVEGMTPNTNNALMIITTLRGFEIVEKQIKEEQNSKKDKDGNVSITISYKGFIKFKHPIHVQVVSPMGQTLWEEVFGDKLDDRRTQDFATRLEAEQNMNSDNFINPIEDATVQKTLRAIQEQLNDKFGYTTQKRHTTVRTFSQKKVVYPEYQEAYNAAAEAYPKIGDLSKKAEVFAAFNKAIPLWENALTQSNPSDKKARINEKVTISTHYMLAEAYLWIENFEKAEAHLSKLESFKPGAPEKKWAKDLRELLNDQKMRIGAYNKL